MKGHKERNPLLEGLRAHFNEARLATLARARVGIAGAGGLGSNVAMLLARSGIGDFLIIDSDIVEASNLNRQHYWPEQVGLKKVDALAENLLRLNPAIRIAKKALRLDRENLPEILKSSRIWVEALDSAEAKSMFVELALLNGGFTAAASGLCGVGGAPMRKHALGKLVVVGDFKTAHQPESPPLAPRVCQAAAMLADCVLEYVLNRGAGKLEPE